MKEVKYYACETCGTIYENRDRCKVCEEGHVHPIDIKDAKYDAFVGNSEANGYPVSINVRMGDGKIIRYKKV